MVMDDRVDGRDDGGGGGVEMMVYEKYFPAYFPSFHFLFLSFLDFSPFFVFEISEEYI